MTTSIRAEGLGVRFVFDRQRRVLTPVMARTRRHQAEAWGLEDVTLTIEAGEGVALLGPSGSGKTSLLRAFAGVLIPDAGHLEVHGRIASLLSVEAGLLGVLTGRENSLLLGVLAGASRRESREALDDIRARSGLGESFERPCTQLFRRHARQAGLRGRRPVGAGDPPARRGARGARPRVPGGGRGRAHEILRAGGIVVAAGHDHDLLRRLCERALLLRNGRVLADGPFDEVQETYLGERVAG